MSLRVISPTAPDQARTFAAASSNQVDHYMERLVKLVPAETIAAYPLLSALASDEGLWAMILVSWLLLITSIILRWHATKTSANGPQWIAVVIAAVSFTIWVYVMEGHFGVALLLKTLGLEGLAISISSAKEFLAIVMLVIWTILIPVFYTGDSG